jgi:hypothetical protein
MFLLPEELEDQQELRDVPNSEAVLGTTFLTYVTLCDWLFQDITE